jgi:hypothetical protein
VATAALREELSFFEQYSLQETTEIELSLTLGSYMAPPFAREKAKNSSYHRLKAPDGPETGLRFWSKERRF